MTEEEESNAQQPKPKKASVLKKWGVWAGAAAASVGTGMLASPEFNSAVVGVLTGALGAKAFGSVLVTLGTQQAILAARRKLLGIPEPR